MFKLSEELLSEMEAETAGKVVEEYIASTEYCYSCENGCHRECSGNCGGPQKGGVPPFER